MMMGYSSKTVIVVIQDFEREKSENQLHAGETH